MEQMKNVFRKGMALLLAFLMAACVFGGTGIGARADELIDLSLTVHTLDKDQEYIDAEGGTAQLSVTRAALGDRVTVYASPKPGFKLFVIAYGEVMIYRDGVSGGTYSFTVSTTSSGSVIDYVTVVFIEESEISQANLGIRLPVPGDTNPDVNAGFPAVVTVEGGYGFEVSYATWNRPAGGTAAVMEEGQLFYAEIILSAKGGRVFAENCYVGLNDLVIEVKYLNDDRTKLTIRTGLVAVSSGYLWLGDVQVTPSNRSDILGDGGSASFDPATGVLTLENPDVSGNHNSYYQIYASGFDLTVRGSAELDGHYGAVTVSGGNLTLDADISAAGPFEAIYCSGDMRIIGGTIHTVTGALAIAAGGTVTITGGTVNADGWFSGIRAKDIVISGGTVNADGPQGAGIYVDHGKLLIDGGTVCATGREHGVRLEYAELEVRNTITSVVLEGEQKAIENVGGGHIVLGSGVKVSEPADAFVLDTNIMNSDGAFATRVVLLPTVSSGWRKNSRGWWYLNPDGTYPANQWKQINGKWYYFDAAGYMVTGWKQVGRFWYYLKDDCAMQTGWAEIGGSWYYFASNGNMATGWAKIGQDWYCFRESGKMVSGWLEDSGKWYYFKADGRMATGWVKDGGAWYYFNTYGSMATGWKQIGQDWYYFRSSGAMASGEWYDGYWLNADGTWTYPYKASWKQDSRGWRYTDTSGWAAKNTTVRIDGKAYTFDRDGYWVKP
ncbi:MAG: N-acetylmuramoyl-L-alanine amidase family protein [Lachnospiraceae bacterium]|nr:N-acetylmuramoyl-L-alanine amidase family protein [Lachnospiraceae bacterium]